MTHVHYLKTRMNHAVGAKSYTISIREPDPQLGLGCVMPHTPKDSFPGLSPQTALFILSTQRAIPDNDKISQVVLRKAEAGITNKIC